jgi:hypothetical protein
MKALELFLALAALSLSGPLAPAGAVQNHAPDPETVMRRVRKAAQLDYELQANFTYVEQRRDVKISKLGKVTVGPLRTFEVYPSRGTGGTYKRLIAVDGTPLPPAELARRDADHEKNVRQEAEKRRRETPEQRQARQAAEARERQEREAILDDALAVFEAVFVGRERLEGEPVMVFDVRPRKAAPVKTREGRWMKQFGGRVWIGENDYVIAKLDMQALEDVTIGWGIIGRVHSGSRYIFTRRKFEGTWLPAEVMFDGSGRTLLFRRWQVRTVTTFSGYKRVHDP